MTKGVEVMTNVISKSDNQVINMAPKRKRKVAFDSLIRYARMLGYGEIHTVIDAATGLQGFVAIHNLNRGPAIGGCRMVPYETAGKAMEDAIRPGYMMSCKA